MFKKYFSRLDKIKLLGRLVGSLLAIVLFSFLTPLQMAFAQNTPPPYTTSWYMDTSNPATLSTDAYSMGCDLGTHDKNAAGTQDNVVILLFGRPNYINGSYGTDTWMAPGDNNNLVFISTAQIAATVEQFGRGYYACTGSDTTSQLYLGVGTNNNAATMTKYGHGYAWAKMVFNIYNWIGNHGYASQVQIRAANDMELGFNDVAHTKSWLNGYLAGYVSDSNLFLYNVGNAEGCRYPAQPSLKCGSLKYPNWGNENVWYISWSAIPFYPLPEIYSTDGTNAGQWYYLDLYALNQKGGSMLFIGSMTQSQACGQLNGCTGIDNTPANGWNQLRNKINLNSGTYQNILRWSTDMKWH